MANDHPSVCVRVRAVRVCVRACVRAWTYVDQALPVSHQQVPEQAGLRQVSQLDHVVHALHRRGVHGPG